MPRKLRREQTHQITVDSVFDVRIDYEPQAPLRLEAYYPDGYMLRKRKLRNQAKKPYDIVGRKAPDWTLVDAERRVRHAFCGYTPAESDRTITEAIDSLLREQ